MKGWLQIAGSFLLLMIPLAASAQATEDFTNLPTVTPGSYLARTWVGTDGVTWTAQGARTDQVINGKAICFGPTGNRWVTSPTYAGGMGTLTFNYVRAFTNTNGRSFQVWVNGAQVGATVVVSPTSNLVSLYSQPINIGGNVVLEIRSIGAGQIKFDDISWTPFNAGPTVNFNNASGSAPENAGSIWVDMSINPATIAAGTITITVANGTGVTYGVGNDYTTNPAVIANDITVNVPAGATTASIMINIVDDVETEANENITFTITGATGGISLGSSLTHVFTIVDNDVTPTVNFSTLSISVLENAGMQNFQLSINPAAPAAGSITLQVTNGPGAVYGFGNDYLTNPAVIGGFITINIAAGATTASFTVTVLDDPAIEDTETVTFTITNVPAGFAIGGNTSAVLTIGDNDTPPTILDPGDLVVVGVNSNTNGCGGATGDDEISFFCFKPIVPGTTIVITDNGYERCNAGLWGNSEGTVRMTRNGMAIPAGQVITFRFSTNFGPGNVISVAPDNGWSCVSLNGNTTVNMNSGGDQLFFMQGGTWINGGGTHNASYDGTVLFGFSTNATFPWTASCSASPNQRSNLPLSMECFSMAPTLATDFNKYVGPITAATQRNWIIRLDDVTNWSTYANCADYSSSGYNWLSAPIMPITPGTFEAGRWTGARDTDWFECKNWDDAKVPTIAIDVTIDETAIRHCSVGLATGLAPGGTGECASLTVTNNGISRNLTIEANSTLLVDGPVLVERTAGTGALNVNVVGGATLSATELTLLSVNPGEARLNCNTATSLTSLEGDLTLGSGGRITLGAGGSIHLGGNWSNFGSELEFVENTGRVRFNGPADQYITTTGFEEVFYDLDMAKTGGDLILSAPAAVRGTLDLGTGLIRSTAIELLTSRAGSTAINYSDASFVDGPMQKIGNTPFTFPVGKNESLRPCGLRDYVGITTNAFIAEYFAASPITTYNNVLEPTLHHISDCEYWTIDRSIGTANATVELTWDSPESCGVNDLPSLRVARFDGTMWLDRGNGGEIGDFNSGTIPTAAVETLFSPWTLASIYGSNPLPISLISFTAKRDGAQVALEWHTATEIDNDHFTVERSGDGHDFEAILSVPGAGHSQSLRSYAEWDRTPLQGINYYRLRQTDIDGTSTLSNTVSVLFTAQDRPLVVFGESGVVNAVHAFDSGSHYEILDITGRLVQQGISGQDGRTEVLFSMPRGAYIFRMNDGDRVESVRFVY